MRVPGLSPRDLATAVGRTVAEVLLEGRHEAFVQRQPAGHHHNAGHRADGLEQLGQPRRHRQVNPLQNVGRADSA